MTLKQGAGPQLQRPVAGRPCVLPIPKLQSLSALKMVSESLSAACPASWAAGMLLHAMSPISQELRTLKNKRLEGVRVRTLHEG